MAIGTDADAKKTMDMAFSIGINISIIKNAEKQRVVTPEDSTSMFLELLDDLEEGLGYMV